MGQESFQLKSCFLTDFARREMKEELKILTESKEI